MGHDKKNLPYDIVSAIFFVGSRNLFRTNTYLRRKLHIDRDQILVIVHLWEGVVIMLHYSKHLREQKLA